MHSQLHCCIAHVIQKNSGDNIEKGDILQEEYPNNASISTKSPKTIISHMFVDLLHTLLGNHHAPSKRPHNTKVASIYLKANESSPTTL